MMNRGLRHLTPGSIILRSWSRRSGKRARAGGRPPRQAEPGPGPAPRGRGRVGAAERTGSRALPWPPRLEKNPGLPGHQAVEGKTAEPGASCPCREHTGHNRGKPGPDQTNTFAFPEAGGTLERMKQVCVPPASVFPPPQKGFPDLVAPHSLSISITATHKRVPRKGKSSAGRQVWAISSQPPLTAL